MYVYDESLKIFKLSAHRNEIKKEIESERDRSEENVDISNVYKIDRKTRLHTSKIGFA